MLQKLIDAVSAYRLKHSESEAVGGRGVEGLNDAYAHMLAVCDAAQQGVHPTCAICGDTGVAGPTWSHPEGEACDCTRG